MLPLLVHVPLPRSDRWWRRPASEPSSQSPDELPLPEPLPLVVLLPQPPLLALRRGGSRLAIHGLRRARQWPDELPLAELPLLELP